MNAKKTAAAAPGEIAEKRTGRAALVAASAELPTAAASPAALLSEVRALILATRQTVAQGVNSALVLLYWQIGQRIRTNILKAKRAAYGAEILPTLSAKLVPDFGQGFSPRNLARMISLARLQAGEHS